MIKDLFSAKHSGVRMFFHQNFVKPGIVTIDLGHIYDKLFHNRQKGDYADFVHFDPEEVRPWYNEAMRFVEAIEGIIKKEF